VSHFADLHTRRILTSRGNLTAAADIRQSTHTTTNHGGRALWLTRWEDSLAGH
jgi:hypothetical protein